MEIIIQKISEKEIWVGDCKLYLEDDNVIYNVAAKNPDENQAIAILNAIYELSSISKGDVFHICDITDTGRPTPKARKIFLAMEDREKIKKHAFIGLPIV